MPKSGFRILADKVAQENGWKDFNDLIYSCENRSSIAGTIETVEEQIQDIQQQIFQDERKTD